MGRLIERLNKASEQERVKCDYCGKKVNAKTAYFSLSENKYYCSKDCLAEGVIE